MKAEKTRRRLQKRIGLIHPAPREIVAECIKELDELERLASYQIPMKIKAQQYIYTECPRCNYDLSEHVNDGYYRVSKVKFCPNCGQLLKWE